MRQVRSRPVENRPGNPRDEGRGDAGGVPVLDGLEFPGCEQVPMSSVQYEASEQHVEFWDEAAGVAMIADSPGLGHEEPRGLLAGVVERIAQERGARIGRFCAVSLLRYDTRGLRRAMEPDECLYLYPDRANLPAGGSLIVGESDPPDVVVEIDHTTDVRRGKLRVYQSWGFPELWVEVPAAEPPTRRRRRLSGLAIYLLNADGEYEPALASRAFPGWQADEIHAAMNELVITEGAGAILRRVGAALGKRDGTGPEDDPLLRAHRQECRAAGRAEGRVEGRTEGRTEGIGEGRLRERVEMVLATLRERRVAMSPGFPCESSLAALAEASTADIVSASMACRDDADFEDLVRG
ncbi:MAG: Uma2 family endonuclease [Gammaproteobacteria bacterium]|nr:Uma2 family endonuclease [Gammaproteobacteria bacterium]